MKNSVSLQARGKINLLLKVGGLRYDGKHEVVTVLSKIGIYDTVTVSKTEKDIVLSCSDERLPTDEANLAYKAAKIYLDFFGILGGVKINIEKRIPVKAGLGGGSADAGAVLLLMKKLFGKGSLDEIAALAAGLGSDVPFFVYPDEVMLGKGTGEIMTQVKTGKVSLYGVFLSLSEKLSTGAMYSSLDKKRGNIAFLSENSQEKLLSALSFGDAKEIIEACENDFEILAGENEREALISAGAVKTLLCGSGPTVAGLFLSEEAAEKAAREIGKNAFPARIL